MWLKVNENVESGCNSDAVKVIHFKYHIFCRYCSAETLFLLVNNVALWLRG